MDIKLRLQTLVYLIIGVVTWTGMTLWGFFTAKNLYSPVPGPLSVYFIVCFILAGVGLLTGIGLIIWTSSE